MNPLGLASASSPPGAGRCGRWFEQELLVSRTCLRPPFQPEGAAVFTIQQRTTSSELLMAR